MVVGDETNHCCVVRKLNNVVAVIGLKDGAQSWVSSLKGTEHRALGGPREASFSSSAQSFST